MISRNRTFFTLLLLLLLISMPVATGCNGSKHTEADQLALESEDLRNSAMDKYLQAAAGTDNLVATASKGVTLQVNQTITTTNDAEATMNSALSDLSARGEKLSQAIDTNPGDNYQHYLSLMKSSNDKLTETLNTRLSLVLLLGSEPYRLAGWDQIRASEIVKEAQFMQQQESISFNDAEVLRNQANQIKINNPDDFGDF
jgi:hypothetical protein